jgi:hypothetical protein
MGGRYGGYYKKALEGSLTKAIECGMRSSNQLGAKEAVPIVK